MARFHALVVSFLLLTTLSLAQAGSAGDQETIRLLHQQIKELQDRVETLEEAAADADSTDAPHPGPQHQPAADQPAEPNQAPIVPAILHESHGIQWRGFGEVDYKVLDQRQPELSTFGFTPGSAGNFYTGEFALFLTSRINDKASVLSEIVFDGLMEQQFELEVERLLFKYDLNDHLRMSFGRYQTGIGYFNTHYHSGRWFLTTADRPLITEFADEGGLLPSQAIGISVTGLVPSGSLGLNYILEYGSSDTNRPNIDGSELPADEDNGNHVNLGLFVRPDAIPGLQVGGSFYHDNITNHDLTPGVRLGQTIVNAYVVYVRHGVEVLNEGFLIRHVQERSQTVFNMPAFYSQISRRFQRATPFFRYTYANTNSRSIFEDVLLRHGPSFGARYDLNDNIAFKAQLDHTMRKGKPNLNGLQLQLAFAF